MPFINTDAKHSRQSWLNRTFVKIELTRQDLLWIAILIVGSGIILSL